MARVFIAMHNIAKNSTNFNTMPSTYEGFVYGLSNAGNDVLCFHHKEYHREFLTDISDDHLKILQNFNPDLCILFNNNYYDLTKHFDIPIIVYDVDSPNVYANKERLIKNSDRYRFVVNQSAGVELIKDAIKTDIKNIRYVLPFTEVKYEKKLQPIVNIAFCGSHWLWQGCDFVTKFTKSQPNENDRKLALEVLKEFIKYPFVSAGQIYEDNGFEAIKKVNIDNPRVYSARYSGIKRARYLTAVYDLGLEIRGEYWDESCLNYFPEIALCYNSKKTYSLNDVEQFYNSSKIGINVNHIQAISGFSWRVCDILASNSCLVTEYRSEINKLFPNVNIPMFQSEYEAREQCKKLLGNENLRLEIVSKAHEIIEKKHRVKHAIENIEEFLNISLQTNREGSVNFFNDSEKKKIKV